MRYPWALHSQVTLCCIALSSHTGKMAQNPCQFAVVLCADVDVMCVRGSPKEMIQFVAIL